MATTGRGNDRDSSEPLRRNESENNRLQQFFRNIDGNMNYEQRRAPYNSGSRPILEEKKYDRPHKKT